MAATTSLDPMRRANAQARRDKFRLLAWIRPWALGALGLLLVGAVGWWALKRYGGSVEGDTCCTEPARFPTLPVVVLGLSFLAAAPMPRLLHPGRSTTLP